MQWIVERLKAASRPGSIVMIASQASKHVCPGHLLSAYAASKGAVLAFSRNLAMEVATHGIRVNTISPGSVNLNHLVSQPATDVDSMLQVYRDRHEPFHRPRAARVVPILREGASSRACGQSRRLDCHAPATPIQSSVLYHRCRHTYRWRDECVNFWMGGSKKLKSER